MCIYELEEVLARTQTSIWKIYVGLSESLVRFYPCVLLIVLNLLMIRDFYKSLNRRTSLGMDILHSTSTIMSRKRKVTISSNHQSWGEDKNEEMFEAPPSKCHIDNTKEELSSKNKERPPSLVINVSFEQHKKKLSCVFVCLILIGI